MAERAWLAVAVSVALGAALSGCASGPRPLSLQSPQIVWCRTIPWGTGNPTKECANLAPGEWCEMGAVVRVCHDEAHHDEAQERIVR